MAMLSAVAAFAGRFFDGAPKTLPAAEPRGRRVRRLSLALQIVVRPALSDIVSVEDAEDPVDAADAEDDEDAWAATAAEAAAEAGARWRL